MIDWLFRDRATGRYVIAQAPNLPLGIFLVAAAVRWLIDPGGWLGTAVGAVTLGSLVWWAVDEVVRGVNPWRRILGGAVLVVALAGTLA